MSEEPSELFVTLVFVDASRQFIRNQQAKQGMTVGEVVRLSGILNEHPFLLAGDYGLASFGKRLSADGPVRDGQRIEILLPLRMSPMEARRSLARKKRASLDRGGRKPHA